MKINELRGIFYEKQGYPVGQNITDMVVDSPKNISC
jgi:hypothetical protein